jgi:hypothetical protein
MVRTVKCPSIAYLDCASPCCCEKEEFLDCRLPCLLVKACSVKKDKRESFGVIVVSFECRQPVPLRCHVQRIVRLGFEDDGLLEHGGQLCSSSGHSSIPVRRSRYYRSFYSAMHGLDAVQRTPRALIFDSFEPSTMNLTNFEVEKE